MTSRPSVAAVIVHFRQPAALAATLQALREQTLTPSRIIVVDNGDGSDCAPLVPEFGIDLVSMGFNAGYAGAVNRGLAEVDDTVDAVLVLTHECILDSMSIEVMAAQLMANDAVGVVGPLLGNADLPDTVWSAGGSFGRRTRRPFHLGAGRPFADLADRPAVEVQWVDGACMLVRASLIETVGPLDEHWFLYVEEVDWLFRVRAGGWRVIVDPAAHAWQSAGIAPPYLEARNLARWFIRRRDLVALGALVASLVSAGMSDLRVGDWRVAGVRATGLVHGFTGRLNPTYLALRPATRSA